MVNALVDVVINQPIQANKPRSRIFVQYRRTLDGPNWVIQGGFAPLSALVISIQIPKLNGFGEVLGRHPIRPI